MAQLRDVVFQNDFRVHLGCCLEGLGRRVRVNRRREVCVRGRMAVWEAGDDDFHDHSHDHVREGS